MKHGAERTAGILRRGNGWTRLSALVMGAGCLRHGQIVKGLLYLGFEVLYVLFFFGFGWPYLRLFPTLGTTAQSRVWDEAAQIYRRVPGDNSMLILLFSVVTLASLALLFAVWRLNLKSAWLLEQKAARLDMENAAARKRSSILRRELEWIRRGAQARSTKQKARIQRFEEMSAIAGPQEEQKLALGSTSSRLGRRIIECENVGKSMGGKRLLRDFTYTILRDERMAVVGENGCGKTTFLRRYVQYLVAQGHSVCILENDFGAVNVDAMLLQDLIGEHCDIETISGGCDCDTHQRRMRTKLISMAMRGFDRVVIEPSGIFDVDEFYDILRDEPLDRWYTLGSVIAIVDAKLENELSPQADYLLASEAASAGLVVMSRTQLAAPGEAEAVIDHLNRALAGCHCARRFGADDVVCRDWNALTTADFARVDCCGWRQTSYVKLHFDEHKAFTSLYFLEAGRSVAQVRQAAQMLLHDAKYGHVLRVKGFIPDGGGWVELNAARDAITVQPIPSGQEVLIVIGEGLDKAAIEAAVRGC